MKKYNNWLNFTYYCKGKTIHGIASIMDILIMNT